MVMCVRGARVVVDRARQPSFVERVRIRIRENQTRGEARLLTRAAAADLVARGGGGVGSRVAVARSSAGWDFGGCERRAEWYFVHYIRRGVRVSGASHSSRAAVEAVPFPLASAAGIDDPC